MACSTSAACDRLWTPKRASRSASRSRRACSGPSTRLQTAGQKLFMSKGTISLIHSCETRWRDGNDVRVAGRHRNGSGRPQSHRVTAARPPRRDTGRCGRRGHGGSDGGRRFARRVPRRGDAHRVGPRSVGRDHRDHDDDRRLPAASGVAGTGAPNSPSASTSAATRSSSSARPDLAFGRPTGPDARSLLIDFKTGGRHGAHVDDLRFYALVFTLRWGVPPWRVATFYAPGRHVGQRGRRPRRARRGGATRQRRHPQSHRDERVGTPCDTDRGHALPLVRTARNLRSRRATEGTTSR